MLFPLQLTVNFQGSFQIVKRLLILAEMTIGYTDII